MWCATGDVNVNDGDGPGDVDGNGDDGPGDVDVNGDDGPGDVDVDIEVDGDALCFNTVVESE